MISVGLVGLGYWGPNHLRVLLDREDVEVRWICDLDPERLRRYARRCPGARATTNFEEVLRDPETDAVIIATPVATHTALATRSLEAGKHTFVEKPLANTRAEADCLVELAGEASLALLCGQTFLFSPPVRAVKKLIDSGELGDLYFISSSRVNLGLHQKDVSVLWDLAPHDFSIIRYWLGERPEWISAVGRDSIVPGLADVAFLDLGFADGLIAHVELSWLAPSKLRRTVIVGSEKMVVYDDGAPEQVRVFDRGVDVKDPESFGEFQLTYRTGDILSPRIEADEPIAVQLDAFLEAVTGGDGHHEYLRTACDVVAMVEAAEHSMNNHGDRQTVGAEVLMQR